MFTGSRSQKLAATRGVNTLSIKALHWPLNYARCCAKSKQKREDTVFLVDNQQKCAKFKNKEAVASFIDMAHTRLPRPLVTPQPKGSFCSQKNLCSVLLSLPIVSVVIFAFKN